MYIRSLPEEELSLISKLAHEIWPVVYADMISIDQIDYMLNWMYSPASLRKQWDEGHQFFVAHDESNQAIGFCSYAPQVDEKLTKSCFKLHKLYVKAHLHKKGFGKALLLHVIDELRKSAPCVLILNVNRKNPARFFYEHHGFIIDHEVDNEIGHGFFMNDYVMCLSI